MIRLRRRRLFPERLPRGSWLFAILTTLLFTAALATWYGRVPQRLYFSGLFQGDMPTYLCYARVASESPTVFSYPNPHDTRADAVPTFVNLHLTVIGWMLAAGLSPAAVEQSLRIGFGILMFLALAHLVLRTIGRDPPFYWMALWVTGIGGGMAWAAALYEHPWPFEFGPWMSATQGVQGTYYLWFLDVLRNLMYPPEIIYHALFFAMLAALARREYGVANLFYGIGAVCNPFIGVQMSGVMLGMVLAGGRYDRWRWRLASVAIAGVFAAFYRFGVSIDEVGRSIQQQHIGVHNASLTWGAFFSGHGLSLIGPAMLMLDWRFTRRFFRTTWAFPIGGMSLWSLILMIHSNFLSQEQSMQPLHFSRGYLLVGFWLITVAWLQFRLRRSERVGVKRLLAVLVLTTLPDNFLFVRDQYETMPNNPILVWEAEVEEAYRFIAELPGRQHVMIDNWYSGGWLCGVSRHTYAFGTPLTTPFYEQRREEVENFRHDPRTETPIIAWADIIAVERQDPRLIQAARTAHWREIFHNSIWTVFARPSADDAASDGPPAVDATPSAPTRLRER